MKDPSRSNRSSSASNMTISNDVILNNQFNVEDNPFAEYMWMENEEEFNRQVIIIVWALKPFCLTLPPNFTNIV